MPATPEKLFEMYLSPTLHEAITGATVVIREDAGSEFRAFNGMLTGTMLVTVKPKLIVQSWRSAHFHDSDPDSTLILMYPSFT